MLAAHSLTAVKDSFITTIHDKTKTYKNSFRLAVQKFSAWWKEKYNAVEPNISEIEPKDVKLFKTWFEQQPGIKHNTVSTCMSRLRTIFLHAVDEKLIAESPIPRRGLMEGYVKGEQIALTVNEVLHIKNLPDNELTESQRKVKYIFLFLCATGMGYGEMKNVLKEHVEKAGEDYVLTKERNKTGVEFTVLFSPQAKDIYTNRFNECFEGLPSIEYVTRVVKVLAAKAGINKNLTTYVGRKTFATQWMNDGNNIYYLQQILGHVSPKQR
jgi:integrase/recombinase XerD